MHIVLFICINIHYTYYINFFQLYTACTTALCVVYRMCLMCVSLFVVCSQQTHTHTHTGGWSICIRHNFQIWSAARRGSPRYYYFCRVMIGEFPNGYRRLLQSRQRNCGLVITAATATRSRRGFTIQKNAPLCQRDGPQLDLKHTIQCKEYNIKEKYFYCETIKNLKG